MSDIGTLPGERLAGLSADLFHKVQKGVITLDELNLFVQRKNPFDASVVSKTGESLLVDLSNYSAFDPAFIGGGWKVENDEDSMLGKFDVAQIKLETCLKGGESYTTGEERLKRLKKTNVIRLGGKAFRFFWENQHLIPEAWKEKTNGNTTYVFFDGLVVRSPDGDRYSLCLCWDEGRWIWYCNWLGNYRIASLPSAVVASST